MKHARHKRDPSARLPTSATQDDPRGAERLAAEVTAKVVAERLVAELERSGLVIMRKPISVGDGGTIMAPGLPACDGRP